MMNWPKQIKNQNRKETNHATASSSALQGVRGARGDLLGGQLSQGAAVDLDVALNLMD